MPMPTKVKIWTSFVLIILVAATLGACGSTAPEAPLPSEIPSVTADRVEVVYFHRAQRCNSCIYAETGTRYALGTYFEDELASNKIIFRLVNLEDKKNATTVEQYGAFTSSLFINTIIDGSDHIQEVKEIWFILGNDQAFVEIVKGKVEENLKEIPDGFK